MRAKLRHARNKLKYKLFSLLHGADSVRAKGSREELAEFWRNPPNARNKPDAYRRAPGRSEFLVDLLSQHAPAGSSVLEIGCNVGRNLNALYKAGYGPIAAIEISEPAIKEMKVAFPDLAAAANILNKPVEEAIPELEDGAYDVVFSMAVLLHIHPDSDWVFEHIARVTKSVLVTIEDESTSNTRIFPRKYKEIFEALGLRQVAETTPPMLPNYTARVFTKS